MKSRVAVTGAAGQIGYAMVFRLASGAIFGPDTAVNFNCWNWSKPFLHWRSRWN